MSDRSRFIDRHIGPNSQDQQQMLKVLGFKSTTELIQKAAPKNILNSKGLDIGPGMSEESFLQLARSLAHKNKVFKNFIGQGYYGCYTPSVILRNILENPLWYTAYTPYQAEISQGRMEALLNFQTMIMELTSMEIANASLLDEGTAVAEAITMAKAAQRKNKSNKIFVTKDIFSQTLEVLKTRTQPLGLELVIDDPKNFDFSQGAFAYVLQYPGAGGEIQNKDYYTHLCKKAHQNETLVICAADILSLCLLTPPGEWGADIVVGSTQRFGVPMGYGGPHAAYIATKDKFKRVLPGRIIGLSKDINGKPALRLALQTREQHIRREKATSNICTAQVLLAVIASMYAVYHGPEGLKNIALKIHQKASSMALQLKNLGIKILNKNFFDTLTLELANNKEAEYFYQSALAEQLNLSKPQGSLLSLSFDETTTNEDLEKLIKIFKTNNLKTNNFKANKWNQAPIQIPTDMQRQTACLNHPVFNLYHSETEMLRYITKLQAKDLTLAHAMIPLGSCTMKLNATSEMIPVTWPEFGQLHPFVPAEQAQGYRSLIIQLEKWLSHITGFAATSVQPNAGSQGEFAGLLVIKKYLEAKGQSHRSTCLIPSSAHGTNPASAIMAGMKVQVVHCDDQGNIDLNDLKQKALEHKKNLAALMITYPSTHGVFEHTLTEICNVIHDNGGQVYMDGANLNALVGLSQIGQLGPDVCHLNLHKTFCIPHGGGGPGVGPIAVADHLKSYLPGHGQHPEKLGDKNMGAVSAAPYGSSSILPISWGYIAMMGSDGLKEATEVAILNANYIASQLKEDYKILYSGPNGLVAHECIIDTRPFKDSVGVTVDDIAKRLMDFGFHAPTMSWPVAGTLMIEPTESESKQELDRFCQAMKKIRQEIKDIEDNRSDKSNNPLKNAPHSIDIITANQWNHPYTREQAAYPEPWVREHKFWTPVSRLDNAFGDKNLVCSCPPLESYT